MDFYVYEHWRMDTNRPFYVGKGRGRRAMNMANRNPHHKSIVAKVGRENIVIKMVAQELPEATAIEIESDRIALWKRMNLKLANKSDGGERQGSGWTVSAETRKKMSEAKKGKIRTPEHCRRISEALKARSTK